MRAAVFKGKGSIEITERPDPQVQENTEAVVRVVLACVCGSDLWFFRGITERAIESPVGHEFIGVVEETGKEVRDLKKGDFVIAPFRFSDGNCPHCQAGITPSCVQGGSFGSATDGGQGEAARVPFADATLVKIPGTNHSDETLASLLSLSDVMCTGYHAAICAGVKKGDTVAVVGDGAVGLSGVIAAKLLGAERIIALSRNPDRQKLATEFGATDILPERGEAANAAVMELTNDIGVNAALECVGTNEAMQTSIASVRPGGTVGFVGLPHEVEIPVGTLLFRNLGLRGGIAPARVYIPQLLDDVLEGRIHPGKVFDFETDLEHIQDAYEAMDERRAVKSILKVSGL